MLTDVTIVIPSSGRPEKQVTLAQLPPILQDRTKLALYERELEDYAACPGQRWVMPKTVTNIGEKRKYLMTACKTRYLLMLDDDLTFAYRQAILHPKLTTLGPDDPELLSMFNLWYHLIRKYAHVSLSSRQGNHLVTVPYKELGRVCCAYMYDLKRVRESKVVPGRNPPMEDFDLTLQLLRAGLPNAMIYKYCCNQVGSNAQGGCSQMRTPEKQVIVANRLAALHPGFVKVVIRKTKSWKGLETRTDVVVSWKKAYLSSKAGAK